MATIETVTPEEVQAAWAHCDALREVRDATTTAEEWKAADGILCDARTAAAALANLLESEPLRQALARVAELERQAGEVDELFAQLARENNVLRNRVLGDRLVAAQIADLLRELPGSDPTSEPIVRLLAGLECIVGGMLPAISPRYTALGLALGDRTAELATEWLLSGAAAAELYEQLHLTHLESRFIAITSIRGALADLVRAGQPLTLTALYGVLTAVEFPQARPAVQA